MTSDEEIARRAIQQIAHNISTNRDLAEERDKSMARMHLRDGLAQAEVARRLGVSPSAVRLAIRVYGSGIQAEAPELQAAG